MPIRAIQLPGMYSPFFFWLGDTCNDSEGVKSISGSDGGTGHPSSSPVLKLSGRWAKKPLLKKSSCQEFPNLTMEIFQDHQTQSAREPLPVL